MGSAGLGRDGRRARGRVLGVCRTMAARYTDLSVRRASAAIAVVVSVSAVAGGWVAPPQLASATPLESSWSFAARPLLADKGSVSLSKSTTAGVPAFWYPDSSTSSSTDQLLNSPSGAVSFIVANVANGAGSSVDPNYVSAIAAYVRDGVKVYGYVPTDYGSRSLSSVEAEVSDWYSWYGLDGILFDGSSNDPALAGHGSYYNELYDYVKHMTGPGVLGTTVVLNPGTIPAEAYMRDSDIICDFEGPEASYVNATFPAWVNSYPATRFWNIIYDSAGVAPMQSDVSLARGRNAGYVFVTTLSGANPYGGMPSSTLWSAEVSALTNP